MVVKMQNHIRFYLFVLVLVIKHAYGGHVDKKAMYLNPNVLYTDTRYVYSDFADSKNELEDAWVSFDLVYDQESYGHLAEGWTLRLYTILASAAHELRLHQHLARNGGQMEMENRSFDQALHRIKN